MELGPPVFPYKQPRESLLSLHLYSQLVLFTDKSSEIAGNLSSYLLLRELSSNVWHNSVPGVRSLQIHMSKER